MFRMTTGKAIALYAWGGLWKAECRVFLAIIQVRGTPVRISTCPLFYFKPLNAIKRIFILPLDIKIIG